MLAALTRAGSGPSGISIRCSRSPVRLSAMVPFESDVPRLRQDVSRWVAGPWHVIPSARLRIGGTTLDDAPDPLDDDVWDRGSSSSDHAEQHHHQHSIHLEHHAHDDAMQDIGLALISSGTTIFLAFMSAIFAMRLFREVMRPSTQQIQGLNAGADDVPGVLQLDIPGVQPFRPFSGQGYRLVIEPPDASKPEPEVSLAHAEHEMRKDRDTPHSLSPVSAGAQPSGQAPDPISEQVLPHFGGDEAPEVTASMP